jgi:hypothetical protein
MKKKLVTVTFIALSVGVFVNAQLPPPLPVPKSGVSGNPRVKMDAATRSNLLAKAGGFIQKTNETSARIVVLNAQKVLPEQVAVDAVGRLQRFLLFPFEIRGVEATDQVRQMIAKTLEDKKTGVVIVLTEAQNDPALIVAPEARWAIVNVQALKTDNQELYASRVRKEVARAFGYLMGSAHSMMDGCVMKPVLKAEDLDKITVETVSPESLNKVMVQAKLLGVEPARMATYRKAVEEGWAPKPTNAIQKAVWDELKAGQPKQ